MKTEATPGNVRLNDGLGALVARLRACVEDPMWSDHAEVPKYLCAAVADALAETHDLAAHYMAQRDEERRRMARAVEAIGIATQCIHAARNDHWPSFDRLSDRYDDAVAGVMTAECAVTVTPESMRQAVAQSDQMLAVDLCGNCPTEDACYLRGQCAHKLREATLQYRATPLQTPSGRPSGYWCVESELGHPVCDVRDEKTARLFAEALNRRG